MSSMSINGVISILNHFDNEQYQKKVSLESQGLEVPTMGLGCMGMASMGGQNVYGAAEEKEAIKLFTVHLNWEVIS